MLRKQCFDQGWTEPAENQPHSEDLRKTTCGGRRMSWIPLRNLGRTYIACHVILVLSEGQVLFDCEATVKPASKCKIAFFLAPFAVASFVQYFCNVVVRYSAKDKLFRWRNLLCTSHATAPWTWTVVKWGDQVDDTWILGKKQKMASNSTVETSMGSTTFDSWQPAIEFNRKKTLRPQGSVSSRKGGVSYQNPPKLDKIFQKFPKHRGPPCWRIFSESSVLVERFNFPDKKNRRMLR